MNYKNFAITYEQGVEDMSLALIEQGMFNKIRLMPDTHIGKGSAIGFTAPLTNILNPQVVGVDIGCGMTVFELGRLGSVDFEKLDNFIKSNIGYGDFKSKGTVITKSIVIPNWVKTRCLNLLKQFRMPLDDKERTYALNQIASLGGGNHFIELNKDEDGCYYLVIHSGSRNLGHKVCDYYVKQMNVDYKKNKELAKQALIKHLKQEDLHDEIQSSIKEFEETYPKEQIGLTGKQLDNYLHDMRLAQRYASLSRCEMAEIICTGMGWDAPFSFNEWESVHNYIDFNDNIVRKGATPAHKGQKVIIPINMADGSIIATGLGNEDWNYSAPHGAGRLMSRTQAKKQLSLSDAKQAMDDNGVYSTTLTENTLDEAPKTYKDINEIIDAIDGKCVTDIKIIKPVYNFKG